MPRGPVWDGRLGGWKWLREDDMAGPQFFETVMGHRFYEGDVPRIGRALERIAEAMETMAKLWEADRADEKASVEAVSGGEADRADEKASVEAVSGGVRTVVQLAKEGDDAGQR